MKRYIGIIVTLSMIFTMISFGVSAEGNDALWDVNKGKWYYKDAHEVYARGMMQGKENNGVISFKPEDDVSQTEALAMLLRYQDLESKVQDQTKAVVSKRLDQIGIEESLLLDWEKPYVAYAVGLGYIKNKDDGKNITATRIWISQLLVRVLGKESLAIDPLLMKNTRYADDRDVPNQLKGYVNAISELGLMVGSEKGNQVYFDPNGTVSRAQMATMLLRLDQHITIDKNYSKTVVIKALTGSKMDFQLGNGDVDSLPLQNPVFFSDNNKLTHQHLSLHDKVKISVRNGQIVFIDYLGKGEIIENVYYGIIDNIDTKDMIMWITINADKITPFRYQEPLVIKDRTGKFLSNEELKIGREVKITVKKNQVIDEITLTALGEQDNAEQGGKLNGTIRGINDDKKYITLEKENGILDVYSYDENTVIRYLTTRIPKVTDLKKGDQVKLTVIAGKVTELELLKFTEFEEINGRYYMIDKASGFLIYWVGFHNLITIDLSESVEILHNGKPAKVDDLLEDIPIVLTVANGKVIKINMDNLRQGTIQYIDKKSNSITISSPDGDNTTYQMMTNAIIEINTVFDDKKTLDDLNFGDKIHFYLNPKDEIERLLVLNNETLLVESATTLGRYIVANKNNSSVAYYITDNTKLMMKGIDNPTWEDLKGKTATFTFIGKELIQVEVK